MSHSKALYDGALLEENSLPNNCNNLTKAATICILRKQTITLISGAKLIKPNSKKLTKSGTKH